MAFKGVVIAALAAAQAAYYVAAAEYSLANAVDAVGARLVLLIYMYR